MDRIQEIEKFLNYFSQVYLRNPNKAICSDSFYYKLTLFGLTPEEIIKKREYGVNTTIERDYFNAWQRDFSNNPNLNVYWTSRQGSFLQFNNSKNNNSECYKLYLSFPEDKMYECVKMIFEYIAYNKMETFSKVANCIRSDSVILRMAKKSDAIKVMDYINNTPQISQYCKPTNPFLPRNGKVGIAYDRWMSFNANLSFMLEKYFKEKRATATLDRVSVDDFRYYVLRFYNAIVSNRESLEYLVGENRFANETMRLSWLTKNEVFSNMKDIIELIIAGLDQNMQIDQYYHKIDTFMDPNHNRENCLIFDRVINSNQSEKNSDVEDIELATQIVDAYIIYALEKYSSAMEVCKYLEIYLQGNLAAITRDKEFRFKFAKYVSSETLNQIVNGDLYTYVVNISNAVNKDSSTMDYYNVFDMACNATLKKYSLAQLQTALLMGINGNYRYFTNGGQMMYRDKLRKIPSEIFIRYANERLQQLNNQFGDDHQKRR